MHHVTSTIHQLPATIHYPIHDNKLSISDTIHHPQERIWWLVLAGAGWCWLVLAGAGWCWWLVAGGWAVATRGGRWLVAGGRITKTYKALVFLANAGQGPPPPYSRVLGLPS